MRKLMATLAAFGLVLGLFGAGISATFNDLATAQSSVHVGTFGITINTPGGTQSADGSSVTFTCPMIVSSVAGSCVQTFTIYNTESIPANVSVAITTPPTAPFMSVDPTLSAPVVLAGGGQVTFDGGIAWPELGNGALGMSTSITYTVTATQ